MEPRLPFDRNVASWKTPSCQAQDFSSCGVCPGAPMEGGEPVPLPLGTSPSAWVPQPLPLTQGLLWRAQACPAPPSPHSALKQRTPGRLPGPGVLRSIAGEREGGARGSSNSSQRAAPVISIKHINSRLATCFINGLI